MRERSGHLAKRLNAGIPCWGASAGSQVLAPDSSFQSRQALGCDGQSGLFPATHRGDLDSIPGSSCWPSAMEGIWAVNQ